MSNLSEAMATLVAARKEQYPNKSEFVRRLGYTYTTVESWEAGRTSPTLDNIEDYATAVGYRFVAVKRDEDN